MSGDVTNDELIGILADGQLCGPDRCSSRVPNACTCALAAARMKEALGKLDEYEHREKLHMDRCRHDMERIVRLEQQLGRYHGKARYRVLHDHGLAEGKGAPAGTARRVTAICYGASPPTLVAAAAWTNSTSRAGLSLDAARISGLSSARAPGIA